MKAKELIEILKSIPQETELNFYLITNDGSDEDSDKNDEPLENLSVIYSAGVEDGHDGIPYLDFGLQQPLPRFDDDYTKYNIDDYIDRKTDEDITYSRLDNEKDIVILGSDNSKVGVAKILFDWEMEDREYIAINHNVIYIDNMKEI